MSTSSESLDFLERCEFSRFGMLLDSTDSGIWTDSGNGDVGSGFCDANAPAPKLARVGVVASSMGGRGVSVGAVLGLGVMGDAIESSWIESAGANGVLTGRKAAAMVRGGACECDGVRVQPGTRDCRRGVE